MKIGLISDTHIQDIDKNNNNNNNNDNNNNNNDNEKNNSNRDNTNKQIPQSVFESFKEVELILHAGDLVSYEVIEKLEKIAPVLAVQGNMDRKNGIKLPESETIEIENIKIGVNHGEVFPQGDSQQLHYIAQELGVDILISGHTHQPHIETYENVLLINPGSPTFPRLADPTVMILTIKDGESDIEVKKIGRPICTALNLEEELKKKKTKN